MSKPKRTNSGSDAPSGKMSQNKSANPIKTQPPLIAQQPVVTNIINNNNINNYFIQPSGVVKKAPAEVVKT
jgi:hypothetical protein